MMMTEGNPPVTESEIRRFESVTHRVFPESYRDFLKAHNGGCPDTNSYATSNRETEGEIRLFLGITETEYKGLSQYFLAYRERMPPEYFPIAYDSGGNLLCLRETDGHVFYWNHDWEAEDGESPTYENLHLIAPDFKTFLQMLKPIEIV